MYMPRYGPIDVSFTLMWASCQSLGGGCRASLGGGCRPNLERSAKWKGAIGEGCDCRTGRVLGSESRVLHAHQEV